DIAQARAPVLFREDHAHITELAQLLDDFERKDLVLIPLHDVRQNFFGREITYFAPQLHLFRRVIEIHNSIIAYATRTPSRYTASITSSGVSRKTTTSPSSPSNSPRVRPSSPIRRAGFTVAVCTASRRLTPPIRIRFEIARFIFSADPASLCVPLNNTRLSAVRSTSSSPNL